MKGFTLIETIVSMAIIAIGILSIYAAINNINDTNLYCNELNYIVHFSESKFNKITKLEKNVFSFSGNIDKKYRWVFIETDFGVYNIIKQSIIIKDNKYDKDILKFYEYKVKE